MGDYPLIRGDQCATWIIHDVLADGIPRARMEIILQAYLVESDDPAVSSTLFMHSIFQNTAVAFYELRAGVWADWDLGNPTDDFIACRPDKNYFNYLRSHYMSGQHWTEGITAGSEPVEVPDEVYNHLFPWIISPDNEEEYYTEVSVGNPPGDRRALGSVDMGTIGPMQRFCLDFAYVHGRREVQESLNEVVSLDTNVDAVQAYYDAQMHECLEFGMTTSIQSTTELPEIGLYPNPANNLLSINGLNGSADLKIYNQLGQCVLQQMTFLGETIDVTPLASGVYMVQVDGYRHQRLIKQ